MNSDRQHRATSTPTQILAFLCDHPYRSLIFWVSVVLLSLSGFSMIFIDRDVAHFFKPFQYDSHQRIIALINLCGQSEWYLIPSALAALWFWKKSSPHLMPTVYFFATVASVGIATLLIKGFVGRSRPEAYFEEGLYGFYFFETSSNMMGWPSGHATTVFSVAVALMIIFRHWSVETRGWSYTGVLLCAVVFSMARVISSRHFVGDIFAGAGVGAAGALLLAPMLPTYRSSARLAHD